MLHVLRSQIDPRPMLGGFRALADYLRVDMAQDVRESLRVLFLDVRCGLVADEVLSRGSVNSAPAYPREIIRRALELGATGLVLVHNHPSGVSEPSHEDLRMTREIATAGKFVQVQVHDHLIVASSGVSSMRQAGLL